MQSKNFEQHNAKELDSFLAQETYGINHLANSFNERLLCFKNINKVYIVMRCFWLGAIAITLCKPL